MLCWCILVSLLLIWCITGPDLLRYYWALFCATLAGPDFESEIPPPDSLPVGWKDVGDVEVFFPRCAPKRLARERFCATQSVKSLKGLSFVFLGSNWHAKGWASSMCQANPFSWWRVCGRITQASACQNSIKFDTVWCHTFARLIQALCEQAVLQRLSGENCRKLRGLGH